MGRPFLSSMAYANAVLYFQSATLCAVARDGFISARNQGRSETAALMGV